MAKAAVTKEDRIARIRKKLQETDYESGTGFFRPKNGRNVIRILPGVATMEDYFWQDVGKHFIPNSKKAFICPTFTVGGDCPICDMVDELRKEGDKGSKNLASKLAFRKQFWMNVIDRSAQDRGPLIYTAGPTVFKVIAGLCNDPDYGDVTDIEEGYDIVIEKSGEGMDTSYGVRARPKSTSLHTPKGDEEDMTQEWMDAALDLTPVILTEDPDEDKGLSEGRPVTVMPPSRIEIEFNALDASAEEEEEENTVRKARRKRPAPKEDEEEDTEEEEAPRRRSVRDRTRSAPPF